MFIISDGLSQPFLRTPEPLVQQLPGETTQTEVRAPVTADWKRDGWESICVAEQGEV